jgi:hypothetical protein
MRIAIMIGPLLLEVKATIRERSLLPAPLNQYILGYRPSNKSHDLRWRKIKIKLRPLKGLPPLSVYAKTGYYASGL